MLSLLLANVPMLVRNREALFWALVFPLMFVVVFGLFDMEGMGTARWRWWTRPARPSHGNWWKA